MGNYISCSFLTLTLKPPKAAKVIFPDGELRQFREPTKAAELMLECPNFFVVNSRSLHIGRRFSALNADEDLEYGDIYIMFPMKRLNSVVTPADLTVLFMSVKSAANKRISNGNTRVLPESGCIPGEAAETPAAESVELSEFRYRLSVSRSRKPVLESIQEEPVWLR